MFSFMYIFLALVTILDLVYHFLQQSTNTTIKYYLLYQLSLMHLILNSLMFIIAIQVNHFFQDSTITQYALLPIISLISQFH